MILINVPPVLWRETSESPAQIVIHGVFQVDVTNEVAHEKMVAIEDAYPIISSSLRTWGSLFPGSLL
jgi:hypothetical protein